MIRALVDEVVPLDVVSVPESWRSLFDGTVIANAIGEGYAWLITCDKRMVFQQNLSGSTISVLVLPTPRVPHLERIQRKVRAVLRKPVPGHFVILDTDGLPIGRPVPHLAGPAKRTP